MASISSSSSSRSIVDSTTTTSASSFPMKEDLLKGPKLSQLELFLAGAGAGVANKSITAPLDRIRILFQVNRQREFTIRAFLEQGGKIVRKEGPVGLWRGNLMAVGRVMPYGGVQFASFEFYRNTLRDVPVFQSGQNEAFRMFLGGALAGMTATTATYPLDLMRARLAMVQSSLYIGPRYDTYFQAANEILREEGVGAFFRGVGPTLMGIIPHAGVSFMVFETLKPALQVKFGLESEKDLPVAARLAAGGTAGLVAQFFSYPFQVIRRRMQVQGTIGYAGQPAANYGSVRDAVVDICRHEGVRGLYKGVSLTLIKGPLSAAIGFCTNDMLKHVFQRLKIQQEVAARWADRPEVSSEEPVPAHGSEPAQAKPKSTLLEHLISGGVAGACAKTVIAPGDRMKILYQTNPNRQFTWRKGFRTILTIYRNSGVRGMWRGHCATLMRIVPFSATSFTGFDIYHKWLSKVNPADEGKSKSTATLVSTRFLAGAMAGATATSLTYPLELMRARMAAHWDMSPKYPSYAVGFTNIVQQEGFFALWKGLRPTLLGIMPYAGLSFMTFETLKKVFVQWLGPDVSPAKSTATRFACGAVAGVVAQGSTYPLDIVRRRMQVHPGMYRNELHAVRTIFMTEGLRGGLFKGVTVNLFKGPIAVGVSFTVNETMKSVLGVNKH